MATNGVAGTFANADQGVEAVCSRWLFLVAKVLVDEAMEQRSKTDAATPGLLTKSPVLIGFK
ncbi:hypothetical protein [Halochromatium sp.]